MRLKTPFIFILIISMMLINACGPRSEANQQATIVAAVKMTTEAQLGIQVTIDVPIKSTTQIQTLLPSTTPTAATTSTATKDSQMTETSTLELLPCEQQKYQETCYNKPTIRQNQFLITVWIKGFNKNSVPYIQIGDVSLSCRVAISDLSKDSISCSSLIFHNGIEDIKLFSPENKLLYSGKINVVLSQLPTFTPTRKPKNRQNETSVPTPAYPNP